MKQLLIVVSMLLPQVYSLQCCKSNTGSCTNQQHLQTCGVLHDACITMTYVMHLDASINTTKTIRKYIKKCVAGGGPDCERKHCAWFYENHYKYCTAVCCYGNECNKHLETRTRRNFSSSKIVQYDWLVLLFTFLLATNRLFLT